MDFARAAAVHGMVGLLAGPLGQVPMKITLLNDPQES